MCLWTYGHNKLFSVLSTVIRSSYGADVGIGVGVVPYRVREMETVGGWVPVIMGLSCMDDYNGALNPITLRDGELHSARGAGRGGGGGVLSERVRASQKHSHTHTHPFSTRRVPSSLRFQNTSHVSSPCTPLKDRNLTWCGIPAGYNVVIRTTVL
jgi:hypothetical protein